MTEEGEIISHVNISSLQITDGGRYRCVANNSIGIKEQVAQINVYGTNQSFTHVCFCPTSSRKLNCPPCLYCFTAFGLLIEQITHTSAM